MSATVLLRRQQYASEFQDHFGSLQGTYIYLR